MSSGNVSSGHPRSLAYFATLLLTLVATGALYLPYLSGLQAASLWVFAALPPAVLNYLVAEQYRQEPHKVASLVLIGNLGSLVVMPLVLGLIFSYQLVTPAGAG